MIQYSLKCEHNHRFDSWFKSGDAFEKLRKAGMVSCTECGSSDVKKAIMAPRVKTAAIMRSPEPEAPALSEPVNKAEQVLAEIRKHVEKNSEYVGNGFADEARAMYLGDAPERSIWGETHKDEAKKLVDDGIPVAPLPFVPTRKSN